MTIFLRVAIVLRYRGCEVWILVAFWDMLFQMAVSPFYWIDKVMEVVVENVGRMLYEEASIGQNTREAREESTIEG